MDPDVVDALVEKGYKGIVIAGTGLGHVNQPVYPALKRAIEKGVHVVMTVQTLWGFAQMYVYDTGRDLLDIGVVPDSDTLAMPKQHIAITARAAGLIPYGIIGTIADYSDPKAVREVAERSRKFGFEGAACVHPSVVPVLNAAFTPSKSEIDYAHRIMTAYARAEGKGSGAISLDGKMVDVPVVRRAKNLIDRARVIEQRRG